MDKHKEVRTQVYSTCQTTIIPWVQSLYAKTAKSCSFAENAAQVRVSYSVNRGMRALNLLARASSQWRKEIASEQT